MFSFPSPIRILIWRLWDSLLTTDYRRHLRPFFLDADLVTPTKYKKYYDVVCWIVTLSTYNYVVQPFVILTIWDSLRLWGRLNVLSRSRSHQIPIFPLPTSLPSSFLLSPLSSLPLPFPVIPTLKLSPRRQIATLLHLPDYPSSRSFADSSFTSTSV